MLGSRRPVPGTATRSASRRRYLRVTAISAVGAAALLGGCTDTGDETLDGERFPAVHRWLTETAVGGADDTYDGTLLDRRGRDEVRVEVGADGNGGPFAYRPSAVAVSPGTTVRWVWVDDHEGHGVVADPDRQLEESDYEFGSGGPVNEEDHEYARELAREGVALYHCEGTAGTHWSTGRPGDPAGASGGERGGHAGGWTAGSTALSDVAPEPRPVLHLEPHRELGMKGGIAVTE